MHGILKLRGGTPPFVNGFRSNYLAQFHQTAALFSSPTGEKAIQSAVIACSWPGEGTTTVVLGIAKALRDTYGARVLAVEINSLRPAFAQLFAVPQERSLAAVVLGKTAPREAFSEIEPGFSVLPVGSHPAAVRGALPRVLRQVIDAAQEEFDALLVDAPPLLQSADALAAGKVTPRAVLVVEAARTSTDTLQRVISRLAQENISLVGSVLNKEKPCMPRWLYRRLSP